MERTILFRGKRLDNGEWVYGDLIHNDNGYYPMTLIGGLVMSRDKHTNQLSFDGYRLNEVEPNTVGQFIGQDDKCGDHIFEGDIVYCVEEDETAEIKWDEETSRFIIEFFGWISDFDSFYGRDLEVVGNIYEEEE